MLLYLFKAARRNKCGLHSATCEPGKHFASCLQLPDKHDACQTFYVLGGGQNEVVDQGGAKTSQGFGSKAAAAEEGTKFLSGPQINVKGKKNLRTC